MSNTNDGLVIAVHNQFAAVLLDGEEAVATIAGRLRHDRPVVGDDVELRSTPDGSLRIEAVRPRRTMLERSGFRGRRQIVAANLDLLVVVASVEDPPLRANLVDRYLVAAWRGGIEAALALTKVDLEHDPTEPDRVRRLLTSLGHAVIDVAAPSGAGTEQVRELIGQRTAVLAGHSGVGKTTLSNALTGRADATAAVNAVIGRGRHTTTLARRIPLPAGGAIIDTAGIRSYGIAGIAPEELQKAFPEIAAASAACQWLGCLHEPGAEGCAVAGAVNPIRLESYRRILEELETV